MFDIFRKRTHNSTIRRTFEKTYDWHWQLNQDKTPEDALLKNK